MNVNDHIDLLSGEEIYGELLIAPGEVVSHPQFSQILNAIGKSQQLIPGRKVGGSSPAFSN